MKYIIQTLIIDNNRKYSSKDEFKSYFVENYVPENIDPLRIFNFTVMDKYGHDNFFLTFIPPNMGILTHKYFNEDEYLVSKQLREDQQKMMNKNNIDYHISELLIQE